MKIALLCPTRQRFEQCKRMVQSVVATSDSQIDIHLGLTIGDDTDEFRIWHGAFKHDKIKIMLKMYPDGMPTGFKWNNLAERAMEDNEVRIFMLAADDVIFSTPCWDAALWEAYDRKPRVFSFLDNRDPDGTPHPIVTREYIEKMGYFMVPIFLHWFLDSWTVEIGKANNCFTHLKDFMLLHDKPSDKLMGDDTYNMIRKAGWHDRDRWVHKHCQYILEYEKKRLAS